MPNEDAAIVGVGMSGPTRHQPRPGIELAAEAFMDALDDAGLNKDEIDGIVVNIGRPAGPDYDQFAQMLSLDISYANETWAHGRFTGTTIQTAALVTQARKARYVACIYGYHLEDGLIGGTTWKGWEEENRYGGGPHGEEPGVGLTAPIGMAAMAMRLYCERYSVAPDELYHVVDGSLRNAIANPRALVTETISRERYARSRLIVDPLRRADCCPVTEGGACMIVAAGEPALATRKPIRIAGWDGLPAGREEFIWSRPGLGVTTQSTGSRGATPPRSFTEAGVTASDVGLFCTYDAFAPLVWFGLERFGYAHEGGAAALITDQGMGIDSRLPVNSHGGMLGEGHLSGWGHNIEIVRQLRREVEEPRQIADLQFGHWGSCFGESIVYGI
jgi:acetyl-CoA acetyltransferase